MRVAIFIDGKNFYAGWKDRAGGRRIDFSEMARWVVAHAGGSSLWGAYYYTGVETGAGASTEGQLKLTGFLDMLEMQPGFFVERFPRKANTFSCAACGAENRYTQEKEVDTTMVADMLRFAAVGAFDILVLMSGDADYAPAVEGVRAIGKQAFVATWGGAGLSSRIRRAAFDHIDLLNGLQEFERPDDGVPASVPLPSPLFDPPSTMRGGDVSVESPRFREDHGLAFGEADRALFIEEVRRAEEKFHGGYVGANYFVTRWSSEVLEESPDSRRRLLDVLVDDGRVEVYEAADGKKAIRLTRSPSEATTVVETEDDVEESVGRKLEDEA
jgi:uncharacterized LabA/DUF88 family protein